ncbi:MAG: ABC transporter substrate-binding protein [Clostridia bacterium]
MKKILATLLASAMVLTSFAACSSETASSGEETFLIGGSGPLTGDYATYGVSVKQGATIAIDEINAAGGVNGIQLELKMEDDQADSAMAVNAYATLMDAGMKVSLGAVTSGACIAAVTESQEDGLLLLTPSGSQEEIVDADNSFRVCFNDPDQGKYAASFIYENNISDKVAIIYDKSNAYSDGITETFVAQAEEDGLEIVAQEAFTDQSNTDFSVQLQSIKSSGATLVFLPIYAQEAAFILTQADNIGLDVVFFGCDGLDGILEKIGDNQELCEEVMLLTPFTADGTDEVVVDFVAAYKEAYETTPDQFAADGYDAIYTIKAAMEQAGITDINDADLNSKLIAAMTEITVEGTTGTMTWDAGGEPEKTAKAVVIQDGVYVAYE